jgi:hypothetical protein
MRDKGWLQGHIDELTRASGKSMRDTVTPIGRTSGPIEIGEPEEERGIRIDEADAEVVRAEEELTVGDQQTYRVRFSAVDKSAKRCKVQIVGQEGPEIPGRITDPALTIAGNVYTRSLDSDAVAEVHAKPVLRDGRIKTLYISDGRIT